MPVGIEKAKMTFAWNDPAFREAVDARSPWRRGCRWLQSWYRETQLGLEAGPSRRPKPGAGGKAHGVASMLPLSVLDDNDPRVAANFFDDLSIWRAANQRLRGPTTGGLVQEDRLRRNMLGSQPMCFNLFGYLKQHPDVLVDWLNAIDIPASALLEEDGPPVRIEWSPTSLRTETGSAFDAYIEVADRDDQRCFIGIETKYAEDLDDQLMRPSATHLGWTDAGEWEVGAARRLATPRTSQLWLNCLLAERHAAEPKFHRGYVLMLAPGAEREPLDATSAVRMELVDPHPSLEVRWASIESLVEAAARHEATVAWAQQFTRRYLDFTPVLDLLAEDDPRRWGYRADLVPRSAYADELLKAADRARTATDYVYGHAGVIAQLADAAPDELARSLRIEDLVGLTAALNDAADGTPRLRRQLGRYLAYQ